jgi:hypothetical protein
MTMDSFADEIVRQETDDPRRERLERYQRDDPSIDHYIG